MSIVPVENPETEVEAPEERRPERSLQGVLRWVTEKGSNSPTTESDFKEMDPERREFLSKVLESFSVDVIKEFQKVIDNVADESMSIDDRAENLELLSDYCEDLNFARDFDKLGALDPVLKLLQHESPELSSGAAQVLAAVVQNDEQCIAMAVKYQFIKHVVDLLKSNHAMVQLKAMTAVSAMVRGSTVLLEEFLNYPDGLVIVLNIAKCADVSRNKVKALWLLKHLFIGTQDRILDMVVENNGAVGILKALESNHDAAVWEHSLSTLVTLANAEPIKNQLLLDKALVDDILSQRTAEIKNLSTEDQLAHLEEMKDAKRLQASLKD